MRYVALRQKAARCNLEWLNTGDDAHRRKRDDYLFRSAEIVTTVRDVLGHAASKHFAREAERVYGPVRFWPE
jgi:aspartate ammonia-lyase